MTAVTDFEAVSLPETTMWLSVIRQAFTDAAIILPTDASAGGKRKARNEARYWLLHNGPDFNETCALAGLEADAVREQAKRLADAGWPICQPSRPVTRPQVAL